MVLKFLLLSIAMLSLQNQAWSASFDCSKAQSSIEKTVCADGELSQLDSKLSEAYQKTLKGSSDPDAIKAAQKDWLRNQRNTCKDQACLLVAYHGRLSALEAILNSAGPATGGAAIKEQPNKDRADNPTLVDKREIHRDGHDATMTTGSSRKADNFVFEIKSNRDPYCEGTLSGQLIAIRKCDSFKDCMEIDVVRNTDGKTYTIRDLYDEHHLLAQGDAIEIPVSRCDRDGSKIVGIFDNTTGFYGAYKKVLDQRLAQEREGEKAAKTADRNRLVEELKSGKRPVASIRDAVLLYDASQNEKFTKEVPFEPTGEYFVWKGNLIKPIDDGYVVSTSQFQDHGFGFRKIIKNFAQLRQNGEVCVVGKYTTNWPIRTTDGREFNLPVLTDCYVFETGSFYDQVWGTARQ